MSAALRVSLAAVKASTAAPRLPRVLGLRDVVLLYAIAIVSPQWLTTAAQIGPASLLLWLLALLAYFVPSGFAVMELSSRYEGEGGLYIWVKQAFGQAHGFIAGWCYVIANLVYFPTLLLFIAGAATRIGLAPWPELKDSVAVNATISLAVLWFVVGVNLIGLERTRRITNACALVMGAALTIVVVAALVCALRFGSANGFANHLLPDALDAGLIKSFATMMFAFVGLELAPLMGSEIHEPRRVIPRAIVASGGLIVAFYVLGTVALLVAMPKDRIEAIGGMPDAIAAIADRLGTPAVGPLVTLLMAVGSVGVLAAWVAGGVRLPYVVGIDKALPAAFGKVHPRWHSPHIALLASGGAATVLVVFALAGSTIGDGYQTLVDMTVTLTFIPIVYMFAALPVLRARAAGDRAGLLRVPGGRIGVAVVSGLGLLSTLVAIACAFVTPTGADVAMFYAKLVGGCAVFLALGVALYSTFTGKGRREDENELPRKAAFALPSARSEKS